MNRLEFNDYHFSLKNETKTRKLWKLKKPYAKDGYNITILLTKIHTDEMRISVVIEMRHVKRKKSRVIPRDIRAIHSTVAQTVQLLRMEMRLFIGSSAFELLKVKNKIGRFDKWSFLSSYALSDDSTVIQKMDADFY